jgi:hypothetical protein
MLVIAPAHCGCRCCHSRTQPKQVYAPCKPEPISSKTAKTFCDWVSAICDRGSQATADFNNWWSNIVNQLLSYGISQKETECIIEAFINFFSIASPISGDKLDAKSVIFASRPNDVVQMIVNHGTALGIDYAWYCYYDIMASSPGYSDYEKAKFADKCRKHNAAIVDALLRNHTN